MATYGKKASEKVGETMHERKSGTLRSGSGKKVTSRKQAIAIGLSEAREKGAKVPSRRSGRSTSSRSSSGGSSAFEDRESSPGARTTPDSAEARQAVSVERIGTRRSPARSGGAGGARDGF